MLAWASHGPPGARPVLFVAGAATGRSMIFGDDALDRLGIRLITVDRPGLGGSTPDPARTLASTAADLHALVDVVVGSPVPVVANSQGAPFALALAALGGASRLLLVSPADEVAVEPVLGMLDDGMRGVVGQVAADPDGARAFLAGLGADGMESMVLSGADDADRAVYAEPPFLARYRAALAEGFANDGAGYATDTVLAMSPWGLDLSAIPCPVEVWMGERDRGHSPDRGVTLAARLGARHVLVEGAGGALLWTHAEEVLTAAVD